MKLTKYLSLVPYRIPINASLLQKTAEEMLGLADKRESLLEYLGWEEMPEELAAGFPPQKNVRQFTSMLKEIQKRKGLKKKRVQAGYQDFITPRKGVKGWIQKKFRDPKELAMPLGYEAYAWLRESHRMTLLTTLHDALLGYCSSAEPRRVEMEEVTEHQNMFCPVVSKVNLEQAAEVQKALSASLKSVNPLFLIQYCAGYVVKYHMQKGVAYYYGEPY